MLPGNLGSLFRASKPVAIPDLSTASEKVWTIGSRRLAPAPVRQPRTPAEVLAHNAAVPLRCSVEEHCTSLIRQQMLEDTFWIVDLGTVQKLKQDWDAR